MSEPARARILVVDDAATVRAQIVKFLEPEFACAVAADGQEALTKARAARPDAVVLDLEMPVMDGVGFLRALRADPGLKDVPVVIATTATALGRMNECRALRCSGYVLKPVQGDYLRAKLRQLVSGGR